MAIFRKKEGIPALLEFWDELLEERRLTTRSRDEIIRDYEQSLQLETVNKP